MNTMPQRVPSLCNLYLSQFYIQFPLLDIFDTATICCLPLEYICWDFPPDCRLRQHIFAITSKSSYYYTVKQIMPYIIISRIIFHGHLFLCVLSYYVSLRSVLVCRRGHALFTLFVFVCEQWCPIHIVLCFCFVFLRHVVGFSGLSIV